MIIRLISRYRDNTEGNLKYLKSYMRRLLLDGHVPMAGHAVFPQALDDGKAEERAIGMAAGQELLRMCSEVHMLCDLGISEGMLADAQCCMDEGIQVLLKSEFHTPAVILTSDALKTLQILEMWKKAPEAAS